MKRYLKVPLLAGLCALLLLAGLVGKSISDARQEKAAGAAASVVGADGQSELDKKVFPKDKVVDVRITVNGNDFQDMLGNESAEELKTATVDYNGIKLENVGIRIKDNQSLSNDVHSESDRYSFKLSFDQYLTGQSLLGISKINLQNSLSDPTYMREFLTYELAEEMGLPTPKFSYVNVYLNDQLWGFYLAVEQISQTYLERNFDNSTGSLYKAIMQGNGSDLKWYGDDKEDYPSLVKKQGSSNDTLLNMLNVLNNGSDYASVLDVDKALGYIALNVVATNTGSYLGSNEQNYYLYDNDGKIEVLPWDYNMAFGGVGKSALLVDEPTQGMLADRPLIAKLLAVPAYKAKYHEIVEKALDGYLSADKFKARVTELQSLISPYVKADPRSFSTYADYESGISSLLALNESTVSTYKQQLNLA